MGTGFGKDSLQVQCTHLLSPQRSLRHGAICVVWVGLVWRTDGSVSPGHPMMPFQHACMHACMHTVRSTRTYILMEARTEIRPPHLTRRGVLQLFSVISPGSPPGFVGPSWPKAACVYGWPDGVRSKARSTLCPPRPKPRSISPDASIDRQQGERLPPTGPQVERSQA